MAAYNEFNVFVENMPEGVHNLQSDTLKIFLTNDPPAATDTVKANITEITAENGYPAGGPTLTVDSSDQVSPGVYRLRIADEPIIASGGTFGPFQYAVLYNDTPTSPADPLIAWWDNGSPITVNNGETVTIDFDDTNGVFQITTA